VEELAAPLRLTTHRDLGRFHQQEPQQRVALFADMSESPPIAAGDSNVRNPTPLSGVLLLLVRVISATGSVVGDRLRAFSKRTHFNCYFAFGATFSSCSETGAESL
jgi:hypothetical protein